MGSEVLYKLMRASDWARAMADGVAPWSEADRRDGYMHLSAPSQVLETARRHFAGVDDLVALVVPRATIENALKFELAPKRGELFPHLYGPLPAAAVTRVRTLVPCADGGFAFADGGAP